jgi:hypothetical protein
MVGALMVFPALNDMLAHPGSDRYERVRGIAAQEGVSLGRAVEQTGILERLPEEAEVIRRELDVIPEEVSRAIIGGVHGACEEGRPVHFEWREIEPGVDMSAEILGGAEAGTAVNIVVATPHGRYFSS